MEASLHPNTHELDGELPNPNTSVGRLATEASLYAVPPVDISLPPREFEAAVHGLIVEGSADPERLAFERKLLLSVRQAISAERGELALTIHELTARFDELTRRQIHVNGYLRDRPAAELEE